MCIRDSSGQRMAMRHRTRLPFPARAQERRGECRRVQSTSHWRAFRAEYMSRRIVLVTGANGGLGQAISRTFLKESSDQFVWLGVHKATDQATLLTKEFANRCHPLPLDVTRVDSWQQAVKTILQEHQRIDVVVNNAGVHRDGLLATLPQEAWDEVLSTNLDAVFHGCRAVLPAMISQKFGRIINVASLSALLAPAGQTNYAAAKAGVICLLY